MKPAALITILFFACVAGSHAAIATEPIAIQVNVTNETGGPSPANDAEVVLTVYKDNKPLDRKVGRSDAKGMCSFADVPTGAGLVVLATAKNQEMMFSSRPMSLEHAHDKQYQLDISVFDVSTDTSALSIGTHHFVVRVNPQGIFVDEYLQLINSSDKAVTSAEKTTDARPVVLKINLPAGFKDLRFSKYFEEHAVVKTDEGFIDTMAVPPGRHDAVFMYALQADAATVQIAKKAGLPTKDFMVFSQLNGALIEGLGESIGQMTLSDGSTADYFSSIPLEAGDQVSFKITGLSMAQDQDDLWVMFGIVFGVILLVGIVRMLTQRKQQSHQ